MKTVEKVGAQGDVMFIKVDALPLEAKPLTVAGEGRVVVAHSETGHHHVAVAESVRLYGVADPMVHYLVAESAYADVVHERSFDTHETLRLPKGTWEVRRQREMMPDGERQVAD